MKKTLMELQPPPLHGKFHKNFPFSFFELLPKEEKQYICSGNRLTFVKHRKNYESGPSKVSLGVKFKCESSLSCLSRLSCLFSVSCLSYLSHLSHLSHPSRVSCQSP